MANFGVKIEIDGMKEALKMCSSELVKTMLEEALNQTAKDIKEEEIKEIKHIFKNPGRWILNSLYVFRANRRNLEAFVRVKGGAEDLLMPHIEGGTRKQKSSEKWLQWASVMKGKYYVPSVTGRVSPSKIVQIMSALKAFPEVGYMANITERSRKRNKKPREFFAIRLKRGHLYPGVYERLSKGRIKPVLIFVENVFYKKIFDFYGIAQKIFNREFRSNFTNAFNLRWRVNK